VRTQLFPPEPLCAKSMVPIYLRYPNALENWTKVNDLMWFRMVTAALLGFALIAFSQPVSAAQKGKTFTLRVLSYNVNDLPWPLRKKSKAAMKFIGRDLARRRADGTAPDIVLLQEAFTDRSKKLVKLAGYPHVQRGPGRRKAQGSLAAEQRPAKIQMRAASRGVESDKYVSSGLYVLSKYPIVGSAFELFGESCSGNDCKANKAILLVRIQLPGMTKPLDVLTSHMDANVKREASAKKRRKAHRKQTEIVKAFIDRFNGARSALFAGDLNIKDAARYKYFVQRLGVVNAGEVCVANQKKCRLGTHATPDSLWRKTNDHHFIVQGSDFDIAPVFMERNYDQRVKGKRLSDHLGFEAIYQVTPKR